MRVLSSAVLLISSFFACGNTAEKLTTLPYPFTSAAVYDPSTDTYYGRYRVDKTSYLLSINAQTNKSKRLVKLPQFSGWSRNASAIDIKQNRLFFLAYANNKQLINALDYRSPFTLDSQPLSKPVKTMVFNPFDQSLAGLARVNSQEHLVNINPKNGEVSIRMPLPSIGSTHGLYLDKVRKSLFFIGAEKGINALFQVGLDNHQLQKHRSKEVGLDEFVIVDFAKEQVDALFTVGAQSCIDVAGYDAKTNVGFIGHFSSRYKNIEQTLATIDAQLTAKDSGHLSGLSSIQLFVGGGVRSSEQSVTLLNRVYDYLNAKGINAVQIKQFNTGVSHDLFIYNKQLVVM